MAAKLTKAQVFWLEVLAGRNPIIVLRDGVTFNPRLRDQRTFDALERRGLAEFIFADSGRSIFNGYTITDAGRKSLSLKPEDGR